MDLNTLAPELTTGAALVQNDTDKVEATEAAPGTQTQAPIPEAPKRGRGRPKGSKAQTAPTPEAQPIPEAPQPTMGDTPDFTDATAAQAEAVAQAPQVQVDYKAMAEALFLTCCMTADGFLADGTGEWLPTAPEKDAVIEATAKYLASIQAKEIPPGYQLVMVLAAYSSSRMKKPKTSTKLKMMWLWIKVKIFRKS